MVDPASWLIPDPERELVILSITLCALLGFYAYSRKVLDLRASILAAIVGIVLIWYTDLFWFFLLLIFLTMSYMVTMWKYNYKRDRGASQGRGGERGVKNVIANGAVPVAIAMFNGPIDSMAGGLSGFLFIIAISIATADTFGSEIGIMSNRTRLITSPGKRVDPGVDGGVSLLGNASALLGAFVISVFGMIFISDLLIDWGPHGLGVGFIPLIIITMMGFIGCQIDSVLGATFQKMGLLTNNTVNFTTILLGVVISIPLYLVWVSIV